MINDWNFEYWIQSTDHRLFNPLKNCVNSWSSGVNILHHTNYDDCMFTLSICSKNYTKIKLAIISATCLAIDYSRSNKKLLLNIFILEGSIILFKMFYWTVLNELAHFLFNYVSRTFQQRSYRQLRKYPGKIWPSRRKKIFSSVHSILFLNLFFISYDPFKKLYWLAT